MMGRSADTRATVIVLNIYWSNEWSRKSYQSPQSLDVSVKLGNFHLPVSAALGRISWSLSCSCLQQAWKTSLTNDFNILQVVTRELCGKVLCHHPFW